MVDPSISRAAVTFWLAGTIYGWRVGAPSQIFSCSISLKLNSYLLVFPNSFLKSLMLPFRCLPMSQLIHLTLLVTSASYSTRHSPCQIIFPLFLNLAFCLFVTFVESEVLSIILQLKLSLHLSFIPR